MDAETVGNYALRYFIIADGVGAIAYAIAELIFSPNRANALAESAQRYAVEYFKWEGLAAKYKALIFALGHEVRGEVCR